MKNIKSYQEFNEELNWKSGLVGLGLGARLAFGNPAMGQMDSTTIEPKIKTELSTPVNKEDFHDFELKGDSLFGQMKYEEAIELYKQAIESFKKEGIICREGWKKQKINRGETGDLTSSEELYFCELNYNYKRKIDDKINKCEKWIIKSQMINKQDTLIKFIGIPVGGSSVSFINKLKLKGFVVLSSETGLIKMKGTFLNETRIIQIGITPKTKLVYDVWIFVDEYELYDIFNIMVEKYGSWCRTNFSEGNVKADNDYYDYPGTYSSLSSSIYANNMRCSWKYGNGEIDLGISWIRYLNEKLYKINKEEQKAINKDQL